MTKVTAVQRYHEVRRVTLIGTVVDLALGILKILGGWGSHSQALVADGVHSLSDVCTDIIVILAARHAQEAADAEHPYGHARIETAATVALGAFLVVVGLGIAYDALANLWRSQAQWQPEAWALAVAGLSVLSKEAVYRYTMNVAKRLGSQLLRANAWHSRSDAASSVVVILGVGGSLLGFEYLDAVGATVVAWMVAKMGFDLARESLAELIDTGLDPESTAQIRDTILSVPGVADLHLLRTRRMAGRALVDVHIILGDPRVSVSEGHQISEMVRGRLIATIDNIEDVTVHIDPEDDETGPTVEHLALRHEVVARLTSRWTHLEAAKAIRHINLHYLNGKIQVEVELPLEAVTDRSAFDAVTAGFRNAVAGDADIGEVRLLLSRG